MIWCSKFSVSPAGHNQVTWLAMSAQLLALLAVIRINPLCQAPPPWRHNAISWWRHIQNIMSFWNLEFDTLRDIKSMGKYWLNFVFLTSRDKNKTVVCPAAPDSPQVWWTVSRNNTVLSLYVLLSFNQWVTSSEPTYVFCPQRLLLYSVEIFLLHFWTGHYCKCKKSTLEKRQVV